MTNLEYLRALPAEKLAEYLVAPVIELDYGDPDDYGDDYSGIIFPYENVRYHAPDGATYWDLSDAINRTVEWLSLESGMMEVI